MTEELQYKLQKEIENLKNVQTECHKAIQRKQHLDAQLNENKIVKIELDLLKKDAEVYKLIGPILIKQDLEESKQNVIKRMEYITKEIKRTDDQIFAIEKKQEISQENLTKLRNALTKMKINP